MSDSDTRLIEPQSPAQPHVFLRTGSALGFFVLLSLVYNWYYLTGGFHYDDFIFVNLLRQDPLPFSRWLGLWCSADVAPLQSIWWFEGQGASAFWRPVPSVLFEGSIRLFGERAIPLHVISLLVHGLVGATLYLLVRRLTGRPALAFIAGLFFLSCEDHSMGVGWISAVTDPVCVLFVNIALIAHTYWLEKRYPWALAGSLIALAAALLSKESAVIAPLAIVLLTLLMPAGREVELHSPTVSAVRTTGARFLRDWLSWVPAVLLLVVYLTTYKLLGFGGITSGMYIDPFGNPGRYLAHLVEHLPVMWLATLSPVPPSLTMFLPETIAPLALAGALAFIVWIAGLWSLRRSAVLAWAILLYLLALLPQMSTDASERCLYLPTIGSSILLAALVIRVGPIARRVAPEAPRSLLLTRIVGWGVLLGILAPGVLLSAAMPFMYVPSFEKSYDQVATAFSHIDERDPDHVILLNTPGFIHTFYPPAIIEFHTRRPIDVRVLSSLNGVMSVERVAERSFILRADRKGWLTNVFAGMLRSPKPPRRGRVYEQELFTVTLLNMTSDNRDVRAVRFDLRRPLDDRRVLFLHWTGRAFDPIDLAALPLGAPVTLADTSDLWASM